MWSTKLITAFILQIPLSFLGIDVAFVSKNDFYIYLVCNLIIAQYTTTYEICICGGFGAPYITYLTVVSLISLVFKLLFDYTILVDYNIN